jgi:hypothetical protein
MILANISGSAVGLIAPAFGGICDNPTYVTWEWIKAWARIPAATEITEFSEKSKRESLCSL